MFIIIYGLVHGSHPALAKFHYGSDVQSFPTGGVINLDVRTLRGDTPDKQATTPALHRFFLTTVGRPLWDTSDDLSMLKGLRATLLGMFRSLFIFQHLLTHPSDHKFLSDQHIIHRDISAGNILLAEGPDPIFGGEGFLTDLEFAYITGGKRPLPYSSLRDVEPIPRPGSNTYMGPPAVTHIKWKDSDIPRARGAVISVSRAYYFPSAR